jgi:hypothetical protein
LSKARTISSDSIVVIADVDKQQGLVALDNSRARDSEFSDATSLILRLIGCIKGSSDVNEHVISTGNNSTDRLCIELTNLRYIHAVRFGIFCCHELPKRLVRTGLGPVLAVLSCQDRRPDRWSGPEKLRTADRTDRGPDQRPVFASVPDRTAETLVLTV